LVQVLALTVVAGMPPQTQVAASFTTQGTSITVPAGILQAGTHYVVRVNSVFAPHDTFEVPNRSHFPLGEAAAVSGLLQP
jgi:hypothetical protein